VYVSDEVSAQTHQCYCIFLLNAVRILPQLRSSDGFYQKTILF